jgi:hypothetical protein
MTSSRRLAFALVLAAASFSGVPAYGQAHAPTAQELETARTLYKEGKELRAKGDLPGALEKLQAAHALGNTPVTGIELARTYVLAGRIVEAREVCLYIARVAAAPDETEKSVEARAEAATLAEQLRPRIPTLVARVQGLGTGEPAHLSIDGQPVPDAAFTEPQKVDPGKHVVVVRAGEGTTAHEGRSEVDVPEGQAIEIVVTLPPASVPPPPPPPPPPPTAPRSSKVLVKLGLGTAIAGAALGLVAGAAAFVKEQNLSGECPLKACNTPQGTSDLNQARTWATLSTVAFTVGGVGALVGIVAQLTGKPASTGSDPSTMTAWIGVGGAGIHGRF